MNKIFRVEAKQNPQDSTGIWTAMLINYLISIERSYSLILWYLTCDLNLINLYSFIYILYIHVVQNYLTKN